MLECSGTNQKLVGMVLFFNFYLIKNLVAIYGTNIS